MALCLRLVLAMRHNPVVVSHHQECVNNNEHHQEQVHEQEKRVRSETAAMAAETAALTSTAAAESSSVNSNANTSSININKSVGTPVLWSTPRPKQTTATPTSAEAPTSTNQLGHRSYGARQGLFWLHAVSTSCGGGSGQSSCQTTVTKLNAPPPPLPPATHRTTHRASRLVHVMSAWSVKARRALFRHCTDARVYCHATTAMHE